MAHFAELNEDNLVLQVVVINDSDCLDESDNESETVGINFCKTLFGGNWVQTSYNHSIRKNYASVGATYRADLDGFVAPCIFSSWVLDETTCKHEAPVAYPSDGKYYRWNETTTSWDES
jgi:hypothetical protein